MEHGGRVLRRVGWRPQREDGPPRHFVLYDEDANFILVRQEAMMALSPAAAVPRPCAPRRRRPTPRSTSGSARPTPKQYHPSGRYIVIGAGIASINEWANALDAGA